MIERDALVFGLSGLPRTNQEGVTGARDEHGVFVPDRLMGWLLSQWEASAASLQNRNLSGTKGAGVISSHVSTAKALYAYGYTYDAIAEALSVGKAKVGEWLARTVKDNRDKRDRKVLDMWMSYHTQDEIASATGEALGTVKRLLADGDDSLVQKVLQNQTNHTAAFHLTNFEEPLYNAWRQREKTAGLNHSGNSEVRGWIICSTSTPSLSTV